ncbi:MAG: hypothetical protein KF889_07295 [Alphaproteobacteria bacterium]|nr:hypothetical protein [Alphaproteobacteria bacterium]MCW5740626.1 hypothetical protein [Alphaproteobacteria bacterium]
MARDRVLSSDFWTREDVIKCSPMARLLLLGLGNFADDHGVQPLRPCSIRLRVFPGDSIDDAALRALIEELLAKGLLRRYEAEGCDYIAIVDWHRHHRVGKRARRRYPRDPSLPPEPVAEVAPAPTPPPAPPPVEQPSVPPEMSRWRKSVGRALRHFLPHGGPPADTEVWIERWIADGCDLRCDVLPAISVACRPSPDHEGPPGLAAVGAYAEANRVRRLAVAYSSLVA